MSSFYKMFMAKRKQTRESAYPMNDLPPEGPSVYSSGSSYLDSNPNAVTPTDNSIDPNASSDPYSDVVPKDMSTPANNAALASVVGSTVNQGAGGGVGGALMGGGAGGLIMGANPYVAGGALAAGAGLSVLAAKKDREQKQAEMEYQAKQSQLEREQAAIGRLINVGQSLRAL